MSEKLRYGNNSWEAVNVIDGSMSMDASQCNCCAATQIHSPQWIQLVFNAQYLVRIIQILGRGDSMLDFTL